MNTNISGTGNNYNITGGQTRGQTLFHSFTDFSVPNNGVVNFVNVTNPRDIITRVTGNNFSDINGLINSNGANFFLINPNGVTFGPNASLNVGRAFVASTAEGINLVDGTGRTFTFGKSGAGDTPLLSVNASVLFNPSQLVISGGNGQINNFGTLQTSNPNQYIGLIGGNVNINSGQINAPGGRVELGGLSAQGNVVILGSDVNNLKAQLPSNVARGDVSLTNGAIVNVAGSGGGDVAIDARNVQISGGSRVFGGITGLGTPTTVAGNIKINAINDVVISNPNSGIFNNVYPNASGRQGGDVTIEANSVILQDGAQIQAATYATSSAGKVIINAQGNVVLTNRSGIFTNISSTGDGNSEGVNITAKNIVLADLSSIESSNNGGKGHAGDITLNATNGNVSIVGIFDESVLQNNDTDIKSKISSRTSGEGNAGKVTINAQGSVLLANRAGIFTSNEGGQGNAGDVTITATDKVYISGTLDQSQLQGDKIQALSAISSVTNSKGNAGKVTINAQGEVVLENRAGIFTTIQSTGVGNSNGVTIAAKNVTLQNFSTIQSDNFGGKGSAGNVDIKTVGNVDITGTFNPALLTGSDTRALSGISSSTNGKGNTGQVTIDAGGNIVINKRGGIFTNINSTGDGNSKGVNITAQSILLSDLSSIESSNNGGKGNAGDVTLYAKNGAVGIVGIFDESVLPSNDTDIKSKISSSTSGEGNAGNVTIKAQGFVLLNRAGIFTRNEGAQGNAGDITITATSDIINITGTSDQSLLKGDNLFSLSTIQSITQGTGNAGKVTINTPGNLFLANRAGIFTNIAQTGKGDSQGVSIAAKDVTLTNLSTIQANNDGGTGNAGNIDITATGDINITGTSSQSLLKGDERFSLSTIQSITQGTGNAGKVTINTPGNLFLANRAGIFTNITQTGKGDSQGVSIAAKDVTVTDLSAIQADNSRGKGNAGNIDITATGDINITGTSSQSLLKGDNISFLSAISSTTNGKGNTGKVTIDAGGYVLISKRGGIFTNIGSTGDGNSKGVNITAQSILLSDLSSIESSNNGGKGHAGDLTLYAKNGAVGIVGILDESMLPINDTDIKSKISSTTSGEGNAGNVTINAQGFLLLNRAGIFTDNEGGQGNAGDVTVTATGNINITGTVAQSQLQGDKTQALSGIYSRTNGKGNAGKVTVNTQGEVLLDNRAGIFTNINQTGEGDSQGVDIKAKDVTVKNLSTIQANNDGGTGKAGNIDITATGDINITGTSDGSLLKGDNLLSLSTISSVTQGKGNAGKVTITTPGNLVLNNRAGVFTNIDRTGDGNSQGVDIKAKDVTLTNLSTIQANNDGGTGKAGNIDITATGDINITGTSDGSLLKGDNLLSLSTTSSVTKGKGDAGKVTITTPGNLVLNNRAGVFTNITQTGKGNSQGVDIKAKDVTVKNFSTIQSSNDGGIGNAGNIDITATGDINSEVGSNINASTSGNGRAGNITIITNGKYEADNYSPIFAITKGDGDAGNIKLNAKFVTLKGGSEIQTISNAKGKAGDLTVNTPGDGFISISGNAPNGKLPDGRPGGFASGLLATAEKDSSSLAGKISLTTGTLNIENGGAISTRSRTNTAPIQPNNPKSLIVDGKYPEDPGAGSISIDAKNINITGGGQISTTSTGNAPAGDVIIKNASAKIVISGIDPTYEQRKADLRTAFPNGYIIENIVDISSGETVISSSNNSNYEQQKASLLADFPNSYKVESNTLLDPIEVVEFTTVPVSQFSGIFATNREGSTSKGGSILINPASVTIADSGQISASNLGTGEGGNIFVFSNIATLNNGKIFAEAKNAKGGDIKLGLSDYLLLRNGSSISTTSASSTSDGSGGNITIGSPLIIAMPGNNDITANATTGNGGNLNITSQGLFGIKYRPKGQESNLTNDITATSTFGQNGTVNITTPGTDPGKDSTQLPNAPNDASNQISQVCSTNIRDNKLTVTGRGGLPPNANDTLNVDVVWQDARATQLQPTASSATTANPFKLAPPAVGWVFDGKGKVTLIAASTQGQPTGTSVACPTNQK
jgi:filamentous hemagglutinin family protein